MQANVRARDAADEECGKLLDILQEVRTAFSGHAVISILRAGREEMEQYPHGRNTVLGTADCRVAAQKHDTMTTMNSLAFFSMYELFMCIFGTVYLSIAYITLYTLSTTRNAEAIFLLGLIHQKSKLLSRSSSRCLRMPGGRIG